MQPEEPIREDNLYISEWNYVDILLREGRYVEAAKRVEEQLVGEFSDRLLAYLEGAEFLIRCAVLAEADTGNTPEQQTSQADSFRLRARELIQQAANAQRRPPDAINRFAWFLLTAEDNFRDVTRGVKLAAQAAKVRSGESAFSRDRSAWPFPGRQARVGRQGIAAVNRNCPSSQCWVGPTFSPSSKPAKEITTKRGAGELVFQNSRMMMKSCQD